MTIWPLGAVTGCFALAVHGSVLGFVAGMQVSSVVNGGAGVAHPTEWVMWSGQNRWVKK